MTDPLTPERIAELGAKYDAALALVDETTGECMVELPRNAWGNAVIAILDAAPALLDAAEALAEAQARIAGFEEFTATFHAWSTTKEFRRIATQDDGASFFLKADEMRIRAARLLNQGGGEKGEHDETT